VPGPNVPPSQEARIAACADDHGAHNLTAPLTVETAMVKSENDSAAQWWQPRNAGSWLVAVILFATTGEFCWSLTNRVFDWPSLLLMVGSAVVFVGSQGLWRRRAKPER
jgi:hypothetical protein